MVRSSQTKNRIPGGDVAGRIEAVVKNVQQFRPGDEVFGDLSGCGFGAFGAFAEYVCTPENAIVLKPDNISFEEAAAAAQAAVVALQGLRDKGKIHARQKVLINGASGGIGTFAVQIAKSFGAEVTGVCSTRNLELVRSIGVDYVIDYTKEDFTKNGKFYDLILGTAGYRNIFDYKRAMAPKGIYVATGGAMAQIFEAMLLGLLISITGVKKMGNLLHRINQKDLVFVKELFEVGKINTFIDRRYALSEVADALRYYGEKHAKGKVVIIAKPENSS